MEAINQPASVFHLALLLATTGAVLALQVATDGLGTLWRHQDFQFAGFTAKRLYNEAVARLLTPAVSRFDALSMSVSIFVQRSAASKSFHEASVKFS